MMRIIQKIFGFIGMLLIAGGAGVCSWEYFRNKQLFVVLLSNTIVRGSMDVLKKMGLGILAIIVGLICLVVWLKAGSVARRNERERSAALREQEKENREETKRLRKEAEDARREAEEAKKEAEKIRLTLEPKEEKTDNE
ncbi:MAG: hypothetical protein IJL85_00345 [Erysipelotrichaceae bacterium]|nr:hypothetical protein [Erysipelotrichaceae bacterium]